MCEGNHSGECRRRNRNRMVYKESQVVLITGCATGGIGSALAREFAGRGCLVAVTALSLSLVEDLKGDSSFFLHELDVSSDDSVERAVSAVLGKFGKIDVLVNNAGVQCVGPLAEIPMSAVQQTFNINVYGTLRLIQGVVPHMSKRGKGKIVNIGSMAGVVPLPWAGAYAATKAAVHALSHVLRVELRPFGINVINIAPGGIKSNLGSSAAESLGRMPEWKLYKKFQKAIQYRATVSQSLKSTPTEVFARRAVNAVLKENPPAWLALGHMSTAITGLQHLPLSIRDFILGKKFNC